MSQPDFVPERGEIWYSDGTSGFYVLKVDPDVWPFPPASSCGKARIRLPRLDGLRVRRAAARHRGKRLAVKRGRNVRRIAVPRGERTRRVRIRLVARNAQGEKRRIAITRRVKACP
jgi:hypothetical protein